MGGSASPQQQQYCLRWNQHRSNLLTAFDQLLQSEALTDVTLSCGGASIKCHRIILAACSGYFQSLFVHDNVYLAGGGQQQHPIVVFKDIQLTELKAILEFIYRGEVSVAQEQVGALLKAAESLKVKGLYSEDGVASPAAGSGLAGLTFEPTSGSTHAASNRFLPQLQLITNQPVQPTTVPHLPATLLQMPMFKRSPAKTPERTLSSLDKERDGSSSSETTPPEDERDEPMVTDRIQSSRSPVFDHVKDLPTAPPSLSAFVSAGKNSSSNGNRPELKRYRQYTRHDIAAAIEAVRSGQSALQASRLYGVPSRTLYDKVKKLGIVTGRPYRQSIAVAVSLAQGGNLSSSTGSPGSRHSNVANVDDDDSMDVHHHLHHHRNGHFRHRPNTLEELSLYFATSPAAAAAAAAELALSQHQHQHQHQARIAAPANVDDHDDHHNNGTPIHPAPIDLSQNYDRMMRISAADVESQPRDVVDTSNKTAELLAEKSA